mmetsp:Transcript_976/g.2389  ORF Transcript_976/g.2389 Transcript_976/m.2389 type:complete len:143 (-) Transcript_976:823-1251(-)
MLAVNKVILIGNLGKDPEVRYFEKDRMRVSFTLATNEAYKNKAGERVTTTEWHHVVLWTPLARVAEKYLKKGKQVYIEGKLTTRSYIDKTGQAKSITEIVGQQLVLLGRGGKKDGASDVTDMSSSASVDMEQEKEKWNGFPF